MTKIKGLFKETAVKEKRLDPTYNEGREFPKQQIIAEIRTPDGLKLVDIYDTCFPEVNESLISAIKKAIEAA